MHVTIQISDGSGTSITASVPETLPTASGPGFDLSGVRSGPTIGPAINAGPAPTGNGGQERSASGPGNVEDMNDSGSPLQAQSAGPAPSIEEE